MPDAGDKNASLKLRTVLHSVARRWQDFLESQPTMKARLLLAATTGPTWQDTVAWARWLLTTRAYSSSADPALMGRARDTVEVYLKHAMSHIWRLLYPQMADMLAVEWRSYWDIVFGKFHGFFTDEGLRTWADAAGAEAACKVQADGGDEAAQNAARGQAIRVVRDGLRAATGHASTRQHALLSDVYLVQDLLLSETVEVNKAMVVDSAMAMVEEIAHRPGMLVNDRWDDKDSYSYWHEYFPMEMRHVKYDQFGVQGVKTEGGHACTLHLEADAQRSKGNYMEKGEYKTSITPNAVYVK